MNIFRIWTGSIIPDCYRSSLISQETMLKGNLFHTINKDEAAALMADALHRYGSDVPIHDFMNAPPHVIADMVRLIVLSMECNTLYLDADVDITDPVVFMEQLNGGPAAEFFNNTRLFGNGILYNGVDLDTFTGLVALWIKQPPQVLYGTTGYHCKHGNFHPVTEGFIHHMLGMNNNYRT